MEYELQKNIEAVLFLSGEPMSVERLAKIFGVGKEEIKKALADLEKNLENRGLKLLVNGEEAMLGTGPESSKYCEALVKEKLDRSLGRAGLETLAVVLYKGIEKKDGIPRADVDFIRGVNSTFTLRNLLIRGLVERKPNPADKRSYVYSPSMQLLQYLSVAKKEDLPDYQNFIKEMQNALESPQDN